MQLTGEILGVVDAIFDLFAIAVQLPLNRPIALNNDPTLGEADFFTDLGDFIPTSAPQRWGDELGANVTLTERSLLDAVISRLRDAPSERQIG